MEENDSIESIGDNSINEITITMTTDCVLGAVVLIEGVQPALLPKHDLETKTKFEKKSTHRFSSSVWQNYPSCSVIIFVARFQYSKYIGIFTSSKNERLLQFCKFVRKKQRRKNFSSFCDIITLHLILYKVDVYILL